MLLTFDNKANLRNHGKDVIKLLSFLKACQTGWSEHTSLMFGLFHKVVSIVYIFRMQHISVNLLSSLSCIEPFTESKMFSLLKKFVVCIDSCRKLQLYTLSVVAVLE